MPTRRCVAVACLCVGVAAGCAEEPPPNVVVVVLDTVRADAVTGEGPHRVPTPALDALGAESIRYTNALAPAPWTLPSHTSLFTGLYAHEHRAQHDRFQVDESLTTLAERLDRAGYATAAYSANPWINRSNGIAQGFDVFEEVFQWGTKPREKGGDATVGYAIQWLEERVLENTPFFLFVNLLEAHLPYEPPERFLGELSPGGVTDTPLEFAEAYILNPASVTDAALERARDLYALEIRYLDVLLGRLVGALTEAGVLNHTVLVVTSDHGEHFGEDALMGHEFSLHDALLSVPLFLRLPNGERAGEDSSPASLVDVVPTLVDVLGLPRGARTSGVSLLGEPRPDRVRFADYARPATLLKSHWAPRYPAADLSRFDTPLRAVRRGDWTLIEGKAGVRLFEAGHGDVDRAPDEPARVEALSGLLPPR